MKIILSRKGFDAKNGGQASPILPDGTLLSLPIHVSQDKMLTYEQLSYTGKTYQSIIEELKYSRYQKQKSSLSSGETSFCHLDPDIRKEVLPREKVWKAAFGQCNAAQGHLINKRVTKGDIFLFFGWFRQTEEINGQFCYKKNSPDLHVLYGYLQIGEIYDGPPFPGYIQSHAHAQSAYRIRKNNRIYVASDSLALNPRLAGAGCFTYQPKQVTDHINLVLTKSGMTRRRWHLPEFFKDVDISYHKNAFKEDHFLSVAQGQEFVIECNDNLQDWTRRIIELGCTQVINAA